MHNKYWKIASLLLIGGMVWLSCQSNSSKNEAVEIYLASKATAEQLIARRSEINNEVRRIDNNLSNADTVAITIVSNLLDDLDNVDQLLKQWLRDVPAVPGNETGDKKVDPAIKAEDLVKQQLEYKEKIQYIETRINDMNTALQTLKTIPVKPRERMTQ